MTVNQQESKRMHIHYKVVGPENNEDGNVRPLIWLVHGAGGDMNHFYTVTPNLIVNGFRVLLMDVRYHGLSQPLDTTEEPIFKFSHVMQDMRTVLKEVKAIYYSHSESPVPLFVGGFSMGGMVSLLFSSNNREEEHKDFVLKGVVAMASGIPLLEMERPGWDVYRDRSATKEVLQYTKAAIVASALTDSGKEETERAMKLISDPALYECLVEVATCFPVPPVSGPPKAYVPLTRLPILLIWPDHDAYTKQEMETLHNISLKEGIDSSLVTIMHAGHMVVLDKGEEVAKHIIEFCNNKILH